MAGSLADLAKATAVRKTELDKAWTLEEAFEKLKERAAAFRVPFSLKSGVTGKHISFEREPSLDVSLSVHIDGTTLKVVPQIVDRKTNVSVGGVTIPNSQNSMSGAANKTLRQGEYIDSVTENIKKILRGEQVADYVAPVITEKPEEKAEKDWIVTLILVLFAGPLGAHRFYVGKIGSGILYLLTVGIFGIGVLVDLIKIVTGKFTDKDGNPIQRK